MTAPRMPLILLTGFLGSGKTTLLRELLAHPDLADTAVIVNELGEIGLDHLLVEHVAEDLRVLRSGCLCCSLRGDLADTLGDLLARRAAGELSFRRVIVETTGLADPVPVLHTLVAEPVLAAGFQLAGVVCTVDALHAEATLRRHEEARRQVAMADLLLLTKTDLAEPQALQTLRARLAAVNPAAPQHEVVEGRLAPDTLLDLQSQVVSRLIELASTQADDHAHHHHGHHGPHDHHGHAHAHHDAHDPSIQAHCFVLDEPLPGPAFAHWLELVAAMRGEQLLRFKGLVHVAEHPEQPLVVHGAQHVFHPPQRLPRWPSADRRTRLVFIVQGIQRADIERTLHKYVAVSPVHEAIPN